MTRSNLFQLLTSILLCATLASSPLSATPLPTQHVGIVIMHGKGGSPLRLVGEMATSLKEKGYLIANLEMPWSRDRNYDADVATAEKEVVTAIDQLKLRGAKEIYIAGHSMGGVFALYLGGRLSVNGIIAIAPGGNVAAKIYEENLGDVVSRARELVAAGQGKTKQEFFDYEGSKGRYPVNTTAEIYMSWFDPAGAMNQTASIKRIKPSTPVLYIAPTRDYPGLLKVKHTMFDALPSNKHTKLVEPAASHTEAPGASIEAITAWIGEEKI